MLVLSRKINQKLIINGNIEITVLDVIGNAVKIGVSAPKDVQIYREEIYKEIQKTNKEAHTPDVSDVDKLDKLDKVKPSKNFDIMSKLKKHNE
jgi:carbon storage regulator